MIPNSKYKNIFFWTIELLALSLLILIVSRFDFLMKPISVFISTVFVPLIVAGSLYYVLKPVLTLLKKITVKGHKMPHQLAVIITFVLFLAVIAGSLILLIPTLVAEITNLITALPEFAQNVQRFVTDSLQSKWLSNLNLSIDIDEVKSAVGKYSASFLTITAGTLGSAVSMVTSVTINVVTIPVVLFYMLSDGDRLLPAIQKLFPVRFADNVKELTLKMDKTIERYISGQALEMLFVGMTMAVGYLIIGEPYAWLLGVIAGITNIVPYIGPWIGVIPALIVASTQSWKQMLLVMIVMMVVQQLDGNFIYPNVIGKSLQIHPLTIMILLMVAGNLWGIFGMILIVPMYAVARTVVKFAIEMRQLTKESLE
ncbi:AI-2E family transporter [Leuconostoc mesenteroides]|uniref:Predicted permease n=1 Tax=Leuconostoc mesenteroides subsp. mesenteroides (strain ATCC 8293 / DSM 20343 / BCRC 11652 / CCM 1803 / JCM 6124 / NCDO 523 / NBRC 100496 / NCIMB 8023 / NCTC 12954 / NRRL B-1118 / 37Y) TaxID=203120 RepID=Q03V37_LEUMM|nr:AI-2E family transporter [Leuconostoc mesenteroides]ABJ62935.1 Predicted permease [Leuconostoc mesenteroides subsp. mesenteroides ATCC 8293]MCT3041495.1 AI-2E family transporter [Leuconostoc mesenteroides]MCU4664097.1 AI-2E family transporter [Leuconostoc mesenteroides]MDG9746894.1 AI-2E family transporter [Leuconostoc mesenteroides]QQB30313.1 AI-2E family transporter [Leuconostoc mesenteroides]